MALLSNSPLAKGLYHRAIAQSGARFPGDPELRGLATSYRTLAAAERAGLKYAKAHGASSLKDLRAMTWGQLKAGSDASDDDTYGKPPLFRPVVDGWVISLNYGQTYARGLQNDVPFMTGNNLDESGAKPRPAVTLEGFRQSVKQKYGPMVDEFWRLCPATSDVEAGRASNAAVRDGSRVSTFLFTREWKKAAKQNVFTYFWTHAPPGPDRETRGAYHGSEISYVFDNLDGTDVPWTSEDRRIADTMSSYWANFAATGDPNGKDLPWWPPTDPESPTVMEIGEHFRPIPVADDARFDFVRRYFSAQEPW